MGRLIDTKVDFIRAYQPEQDSITPIPDNNYTHILPITIYEAVRKSSENGSTTLEQELDAIYRLISNKQDALTGGTPGSIMTWTSRPGRIGSLEVINYVNQEIIERSNIKIPTERGIGAALDLKANLSDLNSHRYDTNIHVDEAERERWNSAISDDEFNTHKNDSTIHVTEDEKVLWNAMAPLSGFQSHISNVSNPHNVTAHQTGTYSRSEIDNMIGQIQKSFFYYKNIYHNEEAGTGILVDYDEANWNPNLVLQYGEELPDIPNQAYRYYALRPVTNYTIDESNRCDIYVKIPGYAWVLIGNVDMKPGDLVIKYPDSVMYVWLQGRFNPIYTGNNSSGLSGDPTDNRSIWKPLIQNNILSWVLTSDNTVAPGEVYIKGDPGEDGYTPIKNVDYHDGAPGIGVPIGGNPWDILVKKEPAEGEENEDYETTWSPIDTILEEYLNTHDKFESIIPYWEDIVGRPNIVQETGNSETDVMSQIAVTEKIREVADVVNSIQDVLNASGGLDGLSNSLIEHTIRTDNPHQVTPAQIGAVTQSSFNGHIGNMNNPHGVTAEQLNLGNVNNTDDAHKPISIATQAALDNINSRINNTNQTFDSAVWVNNVTWNNETCEVTVDFKNHDTVTFTLPIIETFQTITYDDVNDEFVITLPNHTEHRISVINLITEYVGGRSTNINVNVSNGNVITAEILPESITGNELVDSIVLRANPTTTTQIPTDKTNKIATTKFVKDVVINNLDSYQEDRPLSANMGRILNVSKVDANDVVQLIADTPLLEINDTLTSEDTNVALSARMGFELNLSKAPMIHVHPSGSMYGRASVDLFGHTRASDVEPLMDGVPFVGTDDGRYARADHRHPADATRAPMHWPDVARGQYKFTGAPRAETPPDEVFDDRIATTEWVYRNAAMGAGSATNAISTSELMALIQTTYDSVIGEGDG